LTMCSFSTWLLPLSNLDIFFGLPSTLFILILLVNTSLYWSTIFTQKIDWLVCKVFNFYSLTIIFFDIVDLHFLEICELSQDCLKRDC
jgi:ubiquitin C-terminal hydrolase